MTRGGGWILPIGVGQVMIWQLALLGVLLAPAGIPGAAAVVVAVLAIGMTSVRVGGLHARQWATVYTRYRTHRKVIEPATPPVRPLLPRLHLRSHVDRSGNQLGIVSVDENVDYGVTLRLAPVSRPDPEALVALLRKALERDDLPMHATQLVAWTVPANPMPMTVYWLALRYRADEDPLPARARGGEAEGGGRAVASAALRLSIELSSAGYPNSVLDAPELHQELLSAVGGQAAAGRVVENWHEWAAGGTRQACFVPRRAGDVLPLMGRCVPGSMFTCMSYTLGRDDTGVPNDTAVVRLSPFPVGPRLAPKHLAARLDPRLTIANGRHGQLVLATLPLAL